MLKTVPPLPPARDQQIQIRILQIKTLADIKISQSAFEHVDPFAQVEFVPNHFFNTTLITDL